ncbi:MAG: 50S ribosomal protein L7Ae [Candidatus Micrarchaeia archaeon]
MASYVKFEVPKEISDRVINAVSVAKDTGKIRKGANEATKSIESGKAKLVVIAADVNPEEIVMHLPILCEEKGVPFVYVPTKTELGKAIGITVSCAAIAIEDLGGAKGEIEDIVVKLGQKMPSSGKEEKKEEKEQKPTKLAKEKKGKKKE